MLKPRTFSAFISGSKVLPSCSLGWVWIFLRASGWVRVQSSSSSLPSQDARFGDLRGRSLCFCQESSPPSWLITCWYPRLFIGFLCRQRTPRRMTMRTRSTHPVTARLVMTTANMKKNAKMVQNCFSLFFFLNVNSQVCRALLCVKSSPLSVSFEGSWHSLSLSSEMESFVIVTNSSRGQSGEQPGNWSGYGSILVLFR